MKICTRCRVEQDEQSFCRHQRRPDGLSCWCRSCSKKNKKAHYQKNKDKYKKRNARNYLKNKDRIKKVTRKWYQENREQQLKYLKKYREQNTRSYSEKKLMINYGFSPEVAKQVYLMQRNDPCYICGVAGDKGKPLHTDHCHETGKVRGLICGACNVGVGFFRNSPDYLRKTAEYLENPPEINQN